MKVHIPSNVDGKLKTYEMTYLSEPDSQGRRRYMLEWTEPDGVFRPELGKDGQPVGYRRGQVFFAVPPQERVAAREAWECGLTRLVPDASGCVSDPIGIWQSQPDGSYLLVRRHAYQGDSR